MSIAPRHAILVLGMHRSGTSALTRVVNLLGAALPDDLYPPDAQNPTGYWESQYLVGLNEWVLESAGASWSDCLGFEPDQLAGPGLPGIMASLVEGVRRTFGDAKLFVMKDPRLCLLLDVWLPALRSLDIRVSVLLALRPPLAVARSLRLRDDFTLPSGVALWLRYMLAAEIATRSERRAVVPYDALLTDWRGALDRAGRQIGLVWPSDPTDQTVAGFLRPAPCPHAGGDAEAAALPWQIAGWAADSHAALRQVADGTPNADALRTLDRVRGAFTAWRRASRAAAP